MKSKIIGFLGILLLATLSYGELAQQTPATPEPPTPPKSESPRYREHRQVRVYVASGSYLGVDPRDVTADRVSTLKLNESRGVEVMMVDRDSPAGKAGLKEHDVILAFNGKSIANVEQLRRMLRETQPGKTVPLAISRAGQSMNVDVNLAKRPEQMFAAMPPIPPMPPLDIDIPNIVVLHTSSRNGLMVEDLTPQLADFFGVRDGGGVLVRSVDRGSAADAAGLKAGDVIVKAGNERISCTTDWRRIMHAQHGNVQIGVIRDKREQGLTLKLPEQSPDSSLHWSLPPEFQAEMEQLRAEMEKQRPEFEDDIRVAQADFQKEMQQHRAELEKALQQLRGEQAEKLQKQMKEMQKNLQEMLKSLPKE